MLRHERRLLLDCLGIGAALTLLVIAADGYGLLRGLENFLYDLRARACQSFSPPPTDTLVHLDIDDAAIETIGAIPWPRSTLAQILDEVRLAGPKAVELDLLITEPQRIEYLPPDEDDPARPSPSPEVPREGGADRAAELRVIDHDAELAAALRRLGNVIIPATFSSVPRPSPLRGAMVEELRRDPELDPLALIERLRRRDDVKQLHIPDGGLGDTFFIARREAIDALLRELNLDADTSFERVRATLLPHTPPELNTAAVNVLREQWNKHLAVRAFARFGWPVPTGLDTNTAVRVQLAPLRALCESAAGGATVNYTQFGGSPVIRALPLLLEADGKAYPQMGLALAARMLDVDVARARIERDVLILPWDGGSDHDQGASERQVRIPLARPRISADGGRYACLINVPWFGGRRWETMYDYPRREARSQHLPMNQVWQAVVSRRKIEANNAQTDDAIRAVYEVMDGDPARIEQYNAKLPPPDDSEARAKAAAALLAEFDGYLEQFAQMAAAEKGQREQAMEASLRALRHAVQRNADLAQELAAFRAELSAALKDKAVLVGWTATGAIADFVPTPLHEKCPGVVVHGVVYNGIMTGELWRPASWWVTPMATLGMGVLVAWTTARVPPLRAMLVAVFVAAAFAFVNGTVLFDYGNTIMDAAAPLVVVAVVWSACTLTRVAVEAAERNRITRRFSNYVDPKLVSHVLEDPQARFDGERREMTVVFTDLAGFTSLSEKLGEKVVPLLNELLGELVPVIRDHHQGYVNKFLGDGIMFFFNAPRRMANHASEAVATVLDMQDKLAEFNQRLRQRGLPELAMRASVMTGDMIVGDAGWAGEQSDYTVLGDTVNTGARLEAANKYVGTKTLISARTAEMLDGEFLVRPIGKLKVVGKDELVTVFEPLAPAARATDEQRELARCTEELIDSYGQQRFARTLELADEMDARFGASKLAAIYRKMAQRYVLNPPPPGDEAGIVLTEK